MRASLLLSMSVLIAVPGCSAFAPPEVLPEWVESQVPSGPPMRDMMQVCNLAIVRADFPPGLPDLVDRRLESGWDVQLSPYSNRGIRSMATIEVVDQGNRNYLVRVHVLVQVNKEKHQPLNRAVAIWEDKVASPGRARLVLEHIIAQVRPRGLRQ